MSARTVVPLTTPLSCHQKHKPFWILMKQEMMGGNDINATHPSDHFHLCPLKCHLIFFSYRPCLTSVRQYFAHNCCTVCLSLPMIHELLISNGTRWLNFFHPIQILASTAASASPSTLNMSPNKTYPLTQDLH